MESWYRQIFLMSVVLEIWITCTCPKWKQNLYFTKGVHVGVSFTQKTMYIKLGAKLWNSRHLYGRKQAKWRAGEEVRMEWCGAKMEKKSFSVHIFTGQIYNCIRINLWKVHIVWNDKRYIWKDRRQNDHIYFILSRMRNLKKE